MSLLSQSSEDVDGDLHLTIPIKNLMEEFVCPICFNRISDCYITPCGHNFCKNCIYECLNRKHQCPCCNKVSFFFFVFLLVCLSYFLFAIHSDLILLINENE